MLVTVDTGGTKTLIAEFGQDGVMGEVTRFPTPKNKDEYLATLRHTLEERYKNTTVEALVIALPGIVKNDIALWCNNLGWKNFNVKEGLEGILGGAPILVENDANLAGLSEAKSLTPLPESLLYVTVSTGIGTGVITGGRINEGLRYSEGGRMQLEFDGALREWEDFASGSAIRRAYGSYARNIKSSASWRQIADRISRGFLVTIPLIQPDTIVIGGSIGTHFAQFAPQLEAILREKLPPHIPCPAILQAQHPEEAVLYGSYYYVLDSLAR